MTLRDVLNKLRARGLDATEARCRWAVRNGHCPRPPLNTSACAVYGPEHVDALAAWLEHRGHKIPVTA